MAIQNPPIRHSHEDHGQRIKTSDDELSIAINASQ
jgi:hypothetical protein